MKLCESPDFKDAIAAAANYFSSQGLTKHFIEKDYYITEALRIIAGLYPEEPNRVIFKGGTSLSKGWKLIERFSEDIDLFLNPYVAEQHWGQARIDKALKNIQEKVGEHPNLQLERQTGRSARGISRNSNYIYTNQFAGTLQNRILLEMGIRSGNYPTQLVELSSFLTDFLRKTDNTLGAEDESTFPMMLLHFKRTFVEKLFAIHNYIEEYQRKNEPFQKYTRHYYDLYQLAQQIEVKEMLKSKELDNIKQDYHLVSSRYFSTSHFPPENLSFANSLALFPNGDLRKAISKAYTEQCKSLCYGSYPLWEEVEECFSSIRNHL